MTATPLSVRELADELGVSPKTLRAWMRRHDWRSQIEHGQPWRLGPDQAALIRANFENAVKPETTASPPLPILDPLSELTVAEVLESYRKVLASLRSRGLVRTNNAPVGDLAEYCAAIVYDGLLAPNSEKSYDLVSGDDRRIQVKVRVMRHNTRDSGGFSPIRSFGFDAALFLLINDEDGRVELARELSVDEVSEYGRHRSHTNGTVLRIRQARALAVGTDLTERFSDAWNEMLAQH